MTTHIDISKLNLQQLVDLANAVRKELKLTHTWFDTERPSWDAYGSYLAHAVSLRGSCLRRKVGAVIMDAEHTVISTGYNGKGAGLVNCAAEPCKGATAASGTKLTDCEAIHAELNAVMRCKDRNDIHTVYVTCSPCVTCIDMLLGTPCQRIVFAEEYPHNEESKRRWTAAGREWIHFTKDVDADTTPVTSIGVKNDSCNEHCGGLCSSSNRGVL